MERILGIDTGTNSLGWAIVEYNELTNEKKLVDYCSHIINERDKIEKGNESSKASERTGYRSSRKQYYRRKLRKIHLLAVLIDNKLCPAVDREALYAWRNKKIYPASEAFIQWQRTDDKEQKNPYHYRHKCLTEQLDLSELSQRYILGRALYHLNQRRGYLSNRKDSGEDKDGAVSKGIGELSEAMAAAGCKYLGEYFYQKYQRGERIRVQYTSRKEHYLAEFHAICEKQQLDKALVAKLEDAIFYQRPLKSQKHNVGKCVYEPKKARCPISHPLYEQYRMYQFINNIKIKIGFDLNFRPLYDDEKRAIIPLFLRKSKKEFKFSEIARKLKVKDGQCNYPLETSVTGCPVIAQLSDVFGVSGDIDAWLDAACRVYTLGAGKTRYEIMNDIWHVLFSFDSDEKLKEFGQNRLQLNEKQAKLFSKIKVPQDYASLSLKAIRKILPYMKQYGMIYSHAMFMANLSSVVPCSTDQETLLPILPKEDADDIVEAFNEYDPENSEIKTREEYVKRHLVKKYHLDDQQERVLRKLYHPSMIDAFPRVRKDAPCGCLQLGSPATSSMRNPMAMHSLYRLRHVINTLLRQGKIDRDTIINIELARELNNANMRKAIQQWQRDNENNNKDFAKKIKDKMCESYEPTPTDILKYKLWEEQNHICLYTGKTISLSEVFCANPQYDIEHTIPRSRGGDSTAMNLTLCDSRFNRDVKKTQLPAELANHEEILERIVHWHEKAMELTKAVKKINTNGISDKDFKDQQIVKRHKLKFERDYWNGKYERFKMTEVKDGFSRRQGVDIGIISKYARLYLRSLFDHVYVVKGIATSDFRKMWGLQEEYKKKERVNHCHHTIDAITIACIDKSEYERMANYHKEEDAFRYENGTRPVFKKPWPTFTEDVKRISDELIVSHYTPDNMGKQSRQRLRKNGKFTGQIATGDTARGSLHEDTHYGAIERNGEISCVVRRSLYGVKDKDVKSIVNNIVDDVVRQRVLDAIAHHGNLKKAVEEGIWMNESKGVKINKVRTYANHIKRPLDIRHHRDVSTKEYKRQYHVANDGNYMLGIYVGKDNRGKEKRGFKLINLFEATKHFNSEERFAPLLPATNENGFALKYQLQIGTMVLLYENSPEEIYSANKKELARRLYKVKGLSSMEVHGNKYGTIAMVYHQEARPSTEVKLINGAYKQGEQLRSGITMLHSQLKALVAGKDFAINELGEITFIRNND